MFVSLAIDVAHNPSHIPLYKGYEIMIVMLVIFLLIDVCLFMGFIILYIIFVIIIIFWEVCG
jgi:hypothetical protein